MKQRLTVDKVNAAIGDMATYAEANAQLILAPRKKVVFTLVNYFCFSESSLSIYTDSFLFYFNW